MFIYNFICNGYSYLRNRKYIPMRFLSPFRFIWRKLANFVLPKVLEVKTSNEMITASEFLRNFGVEKQCVVSLTSFPRRIDNVWQVIECLKRQSITPDKILLYLSKTQFPNLDDVPETIISRIDALFEVRLVTDDLRSYKKFYYSFQEFNNDLVLLVDDDIYYPLDMVESMLKTYLDNPQKVICRFGYEMKFDQSHRLMNYIKWPLIQEESDSQYILFGTGGGSLYHPASLYKDVCNKDLFMNLCPWADDIWINAMVRLAGLTIKKMDCGGLLSILTRDNEKLFVRNVFDGQNDLQLKAVDDYYSQTIGSKIFDNKN